LEPDPAKELLDWAQHGLVTVLDVRLPEEYALGHIAGVLNIPLDRQKQQLNQLTRDCEVVAYCRGHWCVLFYEAVALLRKAVIDARRLVDGLSEWKWAELRIGHS
jgi:rhodanese-related sulfurtransferase